MRLILIRLRLLKLSKEKLKLKNDVAAAKVLGVKPSTIARYKRNQAQFGPETAIKMADLLNIPPEKIAADMYAQRSKYTKDKMRWRKAAAALCLVLMTINSSVQMPSLVQGKANTKDDFILC